MSTTIYESGQRVIWTGYKREPAEVVVEAPYRAHGAMPDEWVCRLADGSTLAIQGRELRPLAADVIGGAMTAILHPDDCRLYVSPNLYPDASYAFRCGPKRAGDWAYVALDGDDRERLIERLGDLPSHPGEYVERSVSKGLSRDGSRAMVHGTRIYVRKHHSHVESGVVVRELGAMECVGDIGLTSGPDGANVWRVMIYAHAYPQTFPLADIGAAQDYALSCFSSPTPTAAPKD